jgi:lipopolysaccharide export system protein LptA
MFRTRWLLPFAIAALVSAVGFTYYSRIERLKKDAPEPTTPLKPGIDLSAGDWVYRQTSGARPIVEVRAKQFRQIQEPSKFELEGVEIHLFHKDGKIYDQVKSAKADFDMAEGVLFSDGEVEIVMGVEPGAEPTGRLMHIKSSGVRFESKTGKASTDRAADFEFEQGEGSATGVDYDPNTRDLNLKSGLKMTWRGRDRKAKPMFIEAGQGIYKETESKVYLMPWSKMKRETLTMEGGLTVVTLDKGAIQLAEVQNGRGTQKQSSRVVEYASDQMTMQFAQGTKVKKVIGDRNAKLNSHTLTGVTNVSANKIEMDLDTTGEESVLEKALATGNTVVEAKPVPRSGTPTPDTRILRSDVVTLAMRAGGEEIESVETAGPAVLDFLPNRAGQPKRRLNGDKVWIKYGAENQIESFKTVNATTRTDPAPKPAQKGRPAPKPEPPVLTSSKELVAQFDPKTADLSRLEQTGDFKYQEGDRHAVAVKAFMEPKRDYILLDQAARAWDPTGSTNADKIEINQKTNDFVAIGNVASTRLPDKTTEKPGERTPDKPGQKPASQGPGLLSNEEVMQARAERMTSTNKNARIMYEGSAVAWQGANRLQADRIVINREQQVVEAYGNVISQLVDQAKDEPQTTDGKPAAAPAPAAKKSTSKKKTDAAKQEPAKQEPKEKKPRDPNAAPQFTIVRAPQMIYRDSEHMAHYTGGSFLTRENMTVKAREIRAYLKENKDEDDEGSSLEKAFAQGNVEIRQVSPARVRNGFGEIAEYYVDDDKVILSGAEARMDDSVKGTTKGKQLTWFSNNDELIVDGKSGAPAVSNLKKKK